MSDGDLVIPFFVKILFLIYPIFCTAQLKNGLISVSFDEYM